MSVSSIFGTQLPIGKFLLLIWLIVSLLHAQTGISFSLDNVSAVELALDIGLLFGYYTFFWGVIVLVGSLVTLLIFSYNQKFYELFKEYQRDPKEKGASFKEGLYTRVFEVGAIFLAIYFYSETTFHKLSLIGLALALAFYIIGGRVPNVGD